MRIFMCMRTTIEISDALYHRIKLIAAQRHTTLKRLVTDALESALLEEHPTPKRMTKPPIRLGDGVQIPTLSNSEIAELVVEEEMEKAGKA